MLILFLKNAFTARSRLVFDQISGYRGLDKLTHGIKHHREEQPRALGHPLPTLCLSDVMAYLCLVCISPAPDPSLSGVDYGKASAKDRYHSRRIVPSEPCGPSKVPLQRTRRSPWLGREERSQCFQWNMGQALRPGPELRSHSGPEPQVPSTKGRQATTASPEEYLGKNLRPSSCCPGYNTGQEVVPLRRNWGARHDTCTRETQINSLLSFLEAQHDEKWPVSMADK